MSYRHLFVWLRPEHLHYDKLGLYCNDNFIPCDNPRLEFTKALREFIDEEEEQFENADGSFIHVNSAIADTASMGLNCTIGGHGFGYEQDENGNLLRIPHFGRVVIKGNAEIHNNTCIDRGVLGDTVIGEGTMIDNLVHIAHNVRIGKNCAIISHCNIGGSTSIGDNCYLGMSVTVLNKIKIGNNAKIGAGALILKDVPDNYTDWIKGVWKGAEPNWNCQHDFTGQDKDGFTICKKCGEGYE